MQDLPNTEPTTQRVLDIFSRPVSRRGKNELVDGLTKPPALVFSFELKCRRAHTNKTGCWPWAVVRKARRQSREVVLCDWVSSCRWSPLRKRKFVGLCLPASILCSVLFRLSFLITKFLFDLFCRPCTVLSKRLYVIEIISTINAFILVNSHWSTQRKAAKRSTLVVEGCMFQSVFEPQSKLVHLQSSFLWNETTRWLYSVCFFGNIYFKSALRSHTVFEMTDLWSTKVGNNR